MTLFRPRADSRCPVLVLAIALGIVACLGWTGGVESSAPDLPRAFIDGSGDGWRELGEEDFVNVNCAPDTWTWKDGVLHCTGQPIAQAAFMGCAMVDGGVFPKGATLVDHREAVSATGSQRRKPV